jgi:uncharacterized membrane protein YbhN (UPF0104 family)
MLGRLCGALVPLPGGIGGVEPSMLGILVASGSIATAENEFLARRSRRIP